MADRNPRACRYRLCAETTTAKHGYCAEHEHLAIRHNVKSEKETAALYHTPRWVRYSAQFKKRHPYCVNFEQCHHFTEITDHIIPVEQGGTFWDPANHQPMCRPCHDRKRQSEQQQAKQRRQR